MNPWLDQLHQQLQAHRHRHLFRRLQSYDRCGRVIGNADRSLVNFASNDYLALTGHRHLVEAVARAAQQQGVGSGASRLIGGTLDAHTALEQRFAEFKHAPAALLLPTGYLANLAVLTTLAGPDDLVCCDKLDHASLIDAARYSGATLRTYGHNDHDRLARLLDKTTLAGRPIRYRFIVTDSVFSMDGDCADLPGLCALRDRYEAILIVDEAHATGVLGVAGSGLAERQAVAGRIDVTISTASKALGSLGGIVTAHRLVIETLINAARPFIYTTAVPPTQVAAIDAALDVIRDQPQRRGRLAELSGRLRGALRQGGWPVRDDPTPIIPLLVGESQRAVELSAGLAEAGLLVPAVRPPTVAPGSARLRLSLRCDHTDEDIERLAHALNRHAPPRRP